MGLRQDVVDLVMCYNITWLRLGLEVIYNAPVPVMDVNPGTSLSKFLVQVCKQIHCAVNLIRNRNYYSTRVYLRST